ncbi:hypothetical protein D9613_002099 [Agrocybe pediades]|uniref:UreD-domain-containing protein n=1 Tax=Agrocybe pediades TaxID=84607 RepID=A0A8H4R6Q2_9AGAR|nr:hypothetical protein D9613_002099 [Agrocybe pediades]KAF9569887.1 UreD-domain-containing protein [Agrocybe pediades]
MSSLPAIQAGEGCITISVHGDRAIFSELSSTYPLKLLSPSCQGKAAVVYLLTYGGGLVGGDEIDLVVNVQIGASLMLLSQGSTKVFKSRFERRLASVAPRNLDQTVPTHHNAATSQKLDFHIAPNSSLILLPEPVTCFRNASYNQKQRFHIHGDASVVILDWITSGRMSIGEEWAFSHYHSVNEIFHNGKRIAKDVMLLDSADEMQGDSRISERSLRERLRPYSCYAMLFLFGPRAQSLITDIKAKYDQISVFKTKIPDQLIWSLSPLDAAKGGIVVRVAALETEMVKEWLKGELSGLEAIVGKDLYQRAFV